MKNGAGPRRPFFLAEEKEILGDTPRWLRKKNLEMKRRGAEKAHMAARTGGNR